MAIDRRVTRTRTALADALVALIRRMDYNQITVEDILAEANVGRTTFYAHYTSKDDLLHKSLERLRALLVAAFEGHDEAPFLRDPSWNPSRTLFEHVAEFSDVLSALGDGRAGAILRTGIEEAISNFLRSLLPERMDAGLPHDLVVGDIVARVTTVISWWLERRPEMTAMEAHDLLVRLLDSRLPPEARGFLENPANAN
jgi:AcrR family transcriptional regulator